MVFPDIDNIWMLLWLLILWMVTRNRPGTPIGLKQKLKSEQLGRRKTKFDWPFFKIKIGRVELNRAAQNCDGSLIILVTEGLILGETLITRQYELEWEHQGFIFISHLWNTRNILTKISHIALTVNKTCNRNRSLRSLRLSWSQFYRKHV